MNLHLQDKVIIVTGGAKGIGGAITRLIAEEKGIPVVADRSGEDTQKLMAELKGRGVKCHHIVGELSDPETCKKVVEETLQHFKGIDGLVNNAGLNDSVGLEKGSPERFLKSIRDNLWHYYNVAHYALPALKESKGSIVNIASKTAITGQGNTSAYASAKGGQLALTREWAAELSPFGIRVNAIVPAEVWTPLYEKWVSTFPDPKKKLETIISRIPLGKRMTTAEEIAATAVFLLSDRSSHTTGQWIFVDGGYTHLDRALT